MVQEEEVPAGRATPTGGEGGFDAGTERRARPRHRWRNATVGSPRWAEAFGIAVSVAVLCWLAGGLSIVGPEMPLAGDQVFFNWFATTWRDRLFSGRHPFGYSMDAGLGFPFGYFYFPLPAMVFSAFSLVLTDAVALKMLSTLALCSVPVGAWVMVRLAGAPSAVRAAAPLCAVAFMGMTQPFFAGGNVASTMVGEVAYGLALGLGLVFLGALWAALLGTGSPVRVAWCGALVVLCHLNVALVVFAVGAVAVGGVLLWRYAGLASGAVRRVRVGGCVAALGLALGLAAWFVIPAIEMAPDALGHLRGRDERYGVWLVGTWFAPVLVLGVLGLGLGLWRRVRGAGLVGLMGLLGLAGFVVLPGEPLWNIRCAPLYHLAAFLGVAYLLDAVGAWWVSRPRGSLLVARVAVLVGALGVLGASMGVYRGDLEPWRAVNGGLAAKPEWGLLRALREELRELPAGRMYVVHGSEQGFVGLVSGLVLTDPGSDMTVSANVYVEASRSTGAVDLAQGKVSYLGVGSASHGFGVGSSEPERFEDGVAQLRMLGVRYLVSTDAAVRAKAMGGSELRLVRFVQVDGEVAGVFEIERHAVVEPVRDWPRWTYSSETLWGQRVFALKGVEWLDRVRAGERFTEVQLVEGPGGGGAPGAPAPRVRVSGIEVGEESVRFSVDQVGVPVVVRVSWSSRWRADGATGPFPAAPSVLVVVPRERDVVVWFEAPDGQVRGLWVSGFSVLVSAVWVLGRRRRGGV